MKRGNFLESSNGKYRLYLQEAGYLDLSCGKTTIWNTSSKDNNTDFFYFGNDGLNLFLHRNDGNNLLLYGNNKSSSIWKERVGTAGKARKLVLLEDGNLVLSDDCNKTIWETKTSQDLKCLKGLSELVYIRNCVSIIFHSSLKRMLLYIYEIIFLLQMT